MHLIAQIRSYFNLYIEIYFNATSMQHLYSK